MDTKGHIKAIDGLRTALKAIDKAGSRWDQTELLAKAMAACDKVNLPGLRDELQQAKNQADHEVERALNQRREDLLKAAQDAHIPFKRFSEYDRVSVFKITYKAQKCHIYVGSELLEEVSEASGTRLLDLLQDKRKTLEEEPFERSQFFSTVKDAIKLGRSQEDTQGRVPIRTVYAYVVLLRHSWASNFLKKPSPKEFQPYSTAQFVFDLARFGKQHWSIGEEVLHGTTPNMATVGKGGAMTLPNFESVESLGPQIGALYVGKKKG